MAFNAQLITKLAQSWEVINVYLSPLCNEVKYARTLRLLAGCLLFISSYLPIDLDLLKFLGSYFYSVT